jgi:putative ABC transport system ATP-binding protein
MQDDNPVIELNAVTKSYGKNTVLNNINLKVKSGEFIVIRGKSGVGKSTLLKVLGFLETPDSGTVKLFGKDVTKLNDNQLSELRLQNIGFVFQFFNLLPSLTIQENIELPLALARVKKPQRNARIAELLSYFQLEHLAQRFPESLSGGEKQRIAIIRALANNPKMIIADEPTSSIDDENIQLLMSLLSKIAKNQGVTIVMTTTDLYETYPSSSDYLLNDTQLEQNCSQNTPFIRAKLPIENAF